MSVRATPLFKADGTATPFFVAQWVRRGPAQPLHVSMVLVKNGFPTGEFVALWKKAFPNRAPISALLMVAKDDGTATDGFWFIFA